MDQPRHSPEILLGTVDRASSTVTFTRTDGKQARFPWQYPFATTSTLSALHFSPVLNALLIETIDGDAIGVELPVLQDQAPTAGRLSVYLDQNQWSTIAKSRADPARVDPQDIHAADQLRDWVQQGRILMPLSAGHAFETGKWQAGSARRHLALTMLQLSRGWQMRDPVQVRGVELQESFRRLFRPYDGRRPAPAVITLEPNSLYGSRSGSNYEPPPEFPPATRLMLKAMVNSHAFVDVMLDLEHVECGSPQKWVQANQSFSEWLDGEGRDTAQKRRSIDVLILADLQEEIARAAQAVGVGVPELHVWMSERAVDELPTMPSVGLFREVIQARHLNKGTTWRDNDLADLMYLSCAAGYADYVICERATGRALQSAQKRLGLRPSVYVRMRDAVPVIETALEIQSN